MPVLRASILLCRGLTKSNPRSGTSVPTKLQGMRAALRCSSSSRAASRATGREGDGESNEKDAMESNPEIEHIRSNLDSLHSMTVKELRTLTRKAGVPAKGSKKDLVEALIDYLDNSRDVNSALKSTEQMTSLHLPSKRKGKASAVQENVPSTAVISEVISKQKKSRQKQQLIESTRVETLQNFSVKTEEIIDVRRASLGKEESLMVQGEEIVEEVGFPVDRVEPWTIFAHKKPQSGWIPYNPRTMRPPPPGGDIKFVKLLSWNVNGLRALLKMESFSALQLAQREDFDVLCLQETKLQEKDVEEIKKTLIEGYDNSFWTCSVSKLGYSGTAIISRLKPVSVRYGLGKADHDSEGRLITMEFDGFYLLSAYVPNSGDGLRRLTYRVEEWDPSLANYMKELEKSKPVILTGDLNCAHQEIDIYNPAGNRRSAGFTIEERESFDSNFLSRGFVDTFRKQHPNVVAYTYWGYRHGGRKTNKGWRLDYFLVSQCIAGNVHDSYILPDITGSDHCPVGLILMT